jgi:hypothetical protein
MCVVVAQGMLWHVKYVAARHEKPSFWCEKLPILVPESKVIPRCVLGCSRGSWRLHSDGTCCYGATKAAHSSSNFPTAAPSGISRLGCMAAANTHRLCYSHISACKPVMSMRWEAPNPPRLCKSVITHPCHTNSNEAGLWRPVPGAQHPGHVHEQIEET